MGKQIERLATMLEKGKPKAYKVSVKKNLTESERKKLTG